MCSLGSSGWRLRGGANDDANFQKLSSAHEMPGSGVLFLCSEPVKNARGDLCSNFDRL